MKQLIKQILFLFAFSIGIGNAQSQETDFIIHTDMQTGGIQKIMHKNDKHNMNWIFAADGSELEWFTPEFGWGLGFITIEKAGKKETFKWNSISNISVKDGKTTYTYNFPDFNMNITRSFNNEGELIENFNVENTSSKDLKVVDMGIYTPLKDWYAGGAEVCMTSRCNVHVWAGGYNSSYLNAIRMGTEAPHLGLVVTDGSIRHYELVNTSTMPRKVAGSNLRGGITLKVEPKTIKPNSTYGLTWKVFWHNGYEDFYAKALANGTVIAEADKYFIPLGETAKMRFKSNKKLENVSCSVEGTPISFKQTGNVITAEFKAKKIGDKVVTLNYNGKKTVINLYFSLPTKKLLKKRVDFIIDKQQMKDKSDPRFGAYMVYDNEENEIYQNIPFKVDHDEGAERLGMGVAIANWLQQFPNSKKKYKESLEEYYQFVRYKLQTPEYKVYSTVDHTKRHRGYNYPWVAAFYAELYKQTKNPVYIKDCYHTMRKWYKEFGYDFYAICVPIKKSIDYLREAGFNKEAEILLNDYKMVAKEYDKNGINYPSHEVVFEQSIVSPAVNFYLELYHITKDKHYLEEGEKHLKILEAFNGQQPDYHLNEVGIRHWDGYWFGKRQSWGDTMPHYWSALTGRAYIQYYAATGNEEYLRRGKICLENNLCNIRDNGTGAAVYIYPEKVNGVKAEFYDEWANDQDWALFFFLEMNEILKWK
ncbi:hypothetical protein SAMN05444411_101489 [Lutibacter oricola]|uniref:Six-hairpin glycosidase n=1 Tax=Lutibacter oricola TaxID=762486 RepID=A0A1H2SP23_9FLAO|nr:hypothetical protein [Lutibacter oricola]SDW32799.1 hypothetical protein SAMN05444411_101489 [Lutibacter oricola]